MGDIGPTFGGDVIPFLKSDLEQLLQVNVFCFVLFCFLFQVDFFFLVEIILL